MTRKEQINEAVNTYMNGLFEDGIEIPIEDFENIEEGFIAGAAWADANPKSPWISVKDDLPCNHEELILTSVVTYLVPARLKSLEGNVSYVMCYMCRASKDNEWVWQFYKPGYRVTHWMHIPKLVEE